VRLEEELRRALREGVSAVEASEEAWTAIERRLERAAPERPGRRVAIAALALTVSAASLVGLWLAFRSAPADRLGDEPIDLDPRVTAIVPVGPFPGDIAVGEGAVWVGLPAQPPEQDRQLIVRIDPDTNEVVAQIPMDDHIEELAAGEGAVWGNAVAGTAANPVFSVVRIDPATNELVATIADVSGPLAVGEGALWAVDRAGARAGREGSTLLRIDPGTNRVVARIPLGVALWDVEVGEGYVWVLTFEPDPGEGDILQVDPRTNEVVARIDIPLPGSVFAPALGGGSAWVPVCCVDNELNLVRVDVSSGQVAGEPIRVTQAGAPVAVTAGHVWMVAERGALYGLNVATSEVDEVVSGFEWPAGTFPDAPAELDPDRLAVWVANYRDSVTRIDLLASSTPTPSTAIRGAFYPSTYEEGDRVVMPVTFVDGTTAELLFDPALRPKELGTYGEIAGGLGLVDRSIYFRYGDASSFKGSGPLATYEGNGGTMVEEWDPPPDSFSCPNLVFEFDDWYVGVRTCQDELSSQEKAEWALRLVGRQTADGFLVLEALPPLEIARAGEHSGPQLWLQGPELGWPFITITPGRCEGPASDEETRVMEDGMLVSFARIGKTWYADWCSGGEMTFQVQSPDREYVEAAAEGLRIRDVSVAE
jgi:hypothetical protein